jgi:hypothetical protein
MEESSLAPDAEIAEFCALPLVPLTNVTMYGFDGAGVGVGSGVGSGVAAGSEGDGSAVGSEDGSADGDAEGSLEGSADGLSDGVGLGSADGVGSAGSLARTPPGMANGARSDETSNRACVTASRR